MAEMFCNLHGNQLPDGHCKWCAEESASEKDRLRTEVADLKRRLEERREIYDHLKKSNMHLEKAAELSVNEMGSFKEILGTVVKECTRCKDGEILHATSEADASTKVHSSPCPCCGEARKLLSSD